MKIDDMKIGFIGYGNMGSAIAKGFINAGVSGDQIFGCAGNFEKLKAKAEADHVNACETAADVIAKSDIVFLCIKPYKVAELIPPITSLLKGKIVVSIIAGYHHDKFMEVLEPGTHLLCTGPNTPVAVNQGIFIVEEKHSLTDEEYKLVVELLEKESLVVPMDTHLLAIAGTVSGCGPAFAALFIEALGDAGVMYGIPRQTAYQLVSKMMEGTAALQLATKQHPGAMKDAVCSPNGTTIVGIAALERGGFRSALIDAIKAIEEK